MISAEKFHASELDLPKCGLVCEYVPTIDYKSFKECEMWSRTARKKIDEPFVKMKVIKSGVSWMYFYRSIEIPRSFMRMELLIYQWFVLKENAKSIHSSVHTQISSNLLDYWIHSWRCWQNVATVKYKHNGNVKIIWKKQMFWQRTWFGWLDAFSCIA